MPQGYRLNLPSTSIKKQHENRLLWNDSRSPIQADFFTLGYTGRKLGELTEAILKAGVQSVIDIRQNPISMYRPELSKNNLKSHLEEYGIDYLHCPDLAGC
jgi:hypothetical protein